MTPTPEAASEFIDKARADRRLKIQETIRVCHTKAEVVDAINELMESEQAEIPIGLINQIFDTRSAGEAQCRRSAVLWCAIGLAVGLVLGVIAAREMALKTSQSSAHHPAVVRHECILGFLDNLPGREALNLGCEIFPRGQHAVHGRNLCGSGFEFVSHRQPNPRRQQKWKFRAVSRLRVEHFAANSKALDFLDFDIKRPRVVELNTESRIAVWFSKLWEEDGGNLDLWAVHRIGAPEGESGNYHAESRYAKTGERDLLGGVHEFGFRQACDGLSTGGAA